jgi:hypothetical protein
MKKQTRRFVFVAAGILVFGLGTGLIASYMGLQNIALLGQDGPPDLDYIPADARAVAYVNVRQVMDSELRQRIMQHIHPEGTNDADRFKQETGIDIQTDVDEVVATVTGEGTGQRPLVVTRGRFNPTQIETVAREHGSTVEEYKGVRLLVHPDAEVGVAFVETGVVAVGTPASVRRAIDTKADGQNIRKNEELMRLVRDIDDGNAWTVAHFDAITGGRQLPPEIASQLPPITWFAASGHVNGGVRGMVRVDARDETSAQDLRQVVQGFIALARLQVGTRPEFADVLNSLQLGGTGTTISLSFSIPSEVIDALGAAAAQGLPADRRGPVLQERQPLPQLPSLPL